MTKKVTKRERFEQIKVLVQGNAELVAFCDHELELLTKKNASEKKPTATQVANEGIKEVIVKAMAGKGLMTITDIQKSSPELSGLSNQRVSALIRQLIADGKVTRTEEKRKAYFKVC